MCRSAVKFPSSLVKRLRLKGYKYFEIERDFFNKLGVLILNLVFTATCFCSFPCRWYRQSISNCFFYKDVSPLFPFPLNPGISWKWTEYLSVLCLKVSIYQFCRNQLTKLANLLMHSQCAPSEPLSSSRKTRKLTVCRFI